MGSCAKQLCGFTAALFLHFPDTVYSFSVKSQRVQRCEVVPSFCKQRGWKTVPPALSLEQMLGIKQATNR